MYIYVIQYYIYIYIINGDAGRMIAAEEEWLNNKPLDISNIFRYSDSYFVNQRILGCQFPSCTHSEDGCSTKMGIEQTTQPHFDHMAKSWNWSKSWNHVAHPDLSVTFSHSFWKRQVLSSTRKQMPEVQQSFTQYMTMLAWSPNILLNAGKTVINYLNIQLSKMKSRAGKRQREEKDQKKRRVAIHCVFPMICGSGGSKSRLAKAAGAARGEMKNCTPLWREAHFQVKMFKALGVRTTFGTWDVQKGPRLT